MALGLINILKDAIITAAIRDINLDDSKDTENWRSGKNEICLENWLDDDGSFKPNDSDIIFGHGRRDCVGKMLAMKELHIIMGYLLLNYEFELEDKDIDLKTTFIPVLSIWPEIGVKVTKYK